MAVALLMACASSPRHSVHGDLRFVDTETVGKARHAAALAREIAASNAARTVASKLAQASPVLLALLGHDNEVGEFEARLVACAVQAERRINARFSADRPPTREECSTVVGWDPCGKPITHAMRLGQQKHELALQCAEAVLKELWPASFSIEQRYRFYPHAKMVETVSREQEARFIAQGCTDELRGTIKPDLVLHAERDLLKAVLILDFKFPCPDTNPPQWTRYGNSSPYAGRTQEDVYQTALGGAARLISPSKGVVPP